MDSDNPIHAKHVQEFCNYTDAIMAAAVNDLRAALPAMIQAELSKPCVQIQVDEKSYQAAKMKIDDLFKGIGKL